MTTNFVEVSNRIKSKLAGLQRGGEYEDKLLREVTNTMVGEVGTRIHQKGLNGNGAEIGTYKPSYMRVRESAEYGRDSSTKVILSLSKEMELDFTAVIDGGKYGLGFKREINFKKATWMEEKYKNVYKLTPEENQQVTDITVDFIKKLFN